MKQLMLEHAFRFVDCAVFWVGKHNYRSQRAMEKVGGVLLGERLDARGGECPVYEIRRPS